MKEKTTGLVCIVTGILSLIYFLIQNGTVRLTMFMVDREYNDAFILLMRGFLIFLCILCVVVIVLAFGRARRRMLGVHGMAVIAGGVNLLFLVLFGMSSIFFALMLAAGIGMLLFRDA